MDNQLQIRLADAGAVVSTGGFTWATFAHVNEVLQSIALIVAIASGIAAGLYHYTQWKKNGRV